MAFAVLAELKQMQERFIMIEAKLADSKQATVDWSSGLAPPVVQTAADAHNLSASQALENVGQNSAQISYSLSQSSSTVVNSCSSRFCSVSTPKAHVSAKTGIIIFALSITGAVVIC